MDSLNNCSPVNYFTSEEIANCQECLRMVKDVGIRIYPTDRTNEQRDVFFNQAKLWHLLKIIIYKMFWSKLVDHTIVFEQNGKKYWLTEIPEEEVSKYKSVL